MKKGLVLMLTVCVALGLVVTGCGEKKAESSSEAIEVAKAMETTEEKVDYLVGQAKAFYGSKEFQDVVGAAQYILRYLDKDSQEAQNLLEKARDQLTAAAKEVLKAAEKNLGDFSK